MLGAWQQFRLHRETKFSLGFWIRPCLKLLKKRREEGKGGQREGRKDKWRREEEKGQRRLGDSGEKEKERLGSKEGRASTG